MKDEGLGPRRSADSGVPKIIKRSACSRAFQSVQKAVTGQHFKPHSSFNGGVGTTPTIYPEMYARNMNKMLAFCEYWSIQGVTV